MGCHLWEAIYGKPSMGCHQRVAIYGRCRQKGVTVEAKGGQGETRWCAPRPAVTAPAGLAAAAGVSVR